MVFLLCKINLFYDTASAFDKYIGYGLDKSVYFNALLFNYLSVVATSTAIFLLVRRFFNENVMAFLAGLVYILGFGTIFYELMPCTDAFSVLLFSIALILYNQRSKWILAILLISVLQREYIPLAFWLIATVDLFKTRTRYYTAVAVVSAASFLIYFILRKTYFYTAALDFQASPQVWFHSLVHPPFPIVPFLRQLLLTLNLFIIYSLIVLYKLVSRMKIDKIALLKQTLLLLQIVIISIAAGHGNNVGRYFYIASPLLILDLVRESQFLFPSLQKELPARPNS
jgi:hypothetical protein